MIRRILGISLASMLVFAVVPVHSTGAQDNNLQITSVEPLAETAGLYEKFEIAVGLNATFNNPYNPDEIRLDATFTSPSGVAMTVPGFYYRDFDYQLVNGTSEQLTPTDHWSWRVRFTPTEVGDWTYQVVAATPTSSAQSESMSFTAQPSERHGFIRVDSRNPRYFVFDDGTPYFAVGEDMSWYGNGGTADYAQWMTALSSAGGNWIRVWMASWGFSLEWLDTGLGNYDNRQNRAYQLDKVFEMAQADDIYIMLCLLNHGPFAPATDSEWDNNPYNAANGGPLNDPVEFATNPDAVRLWHQKLRYIAARWGYSPNLMTWEWWNEVNWTPIANPDVLAPWIEASAAYLSPLDPYNHLMTTSGSAVNAATVWNNPGIDFVQDHFYNMRSAQREFATRIPEWWQQYPDKPFLAGEFGSPTDFDVHGLLMHIGLWAAPMAGAAGTGMMWWWDSYVHPNNLYYQFAGVAAYFAGEDLAARQWQLTQSTLDKEADAKLYGLQADDYALLWIVNKDFTERNLTSAYESNVKNGAADPLDIQFVEVANAVLTLSGLQDGAYTVEWWNTAAGTITRTEAITVTDGQAQVAVPAFTQDIAVKVHP